MDAPTEARIARWREGLSRRGALSRDDVAELEEHLREQIDRFGALGLTPEEAFLIGVTRIGRMNDLAREYAREHSDRLWKQLVADDAPRRHGTVSAFVCAALAAVAVQIPLNTGLDLSDEAVGFFVRNAALLVLPFLAAFFLVRRRAGTGTLLTVAAGFIATGVVVNVYPFMPLGATEMLAGLHAAVVLWFLVGLAYTAGAGRSPAARMDFIRFTGEWFVYLVLIALGGGVLTALTIGAFSAIGMDPSAFVTRWMLPSGAAGAVVISAWLVEAKQSVIENIAPVLTRVFTPLFTVLLVALVVAAAAQGTIVDSDRTLLVIVDVVLLVVVGLLLYSISARPREAAPGWFDALQLAMIAAALVVDVFVLTAVIGRTGQYGASAYKTASLGLNVILIANLVGAAVHHVRFLRRRGTFDAVERWQTGFVPVYVAWAAVVVAVFPPLFAFA